MIAPIEPTVDPPAILDIARDYTARGWRVVPIPPRTKAPRLRGWQTLRLDAADLPAHFSPRAAANIGVMTGEPSGWLIDIDLDHPAAIDLADAHLPATGAEWGRKSRPRSHRLYVVTAPTTTRKHTSASGGMLVELRSTGCQTVAPGSVHPCGEPVRWDRDGEPARVAPDALHDAVRRLADAVRETLGESPTSTPPRNADAPARPAATDDRQRAIDALARLSPARADAYHAWIDVGMALHAVCPTLLAEWDRWSRASRKYRDGETAHKWESFGGGGGLTLGSLIHWAGQDDPGGESSADALGWLRRVLRLPDLSGIV
ncbi:MAG: bifunctional DNA primase/polymerase, partial [Dehalococcoidia bacterium]